MALLILPVATHAQRATVRLSIDPGTVVNRIDEKVYGHFLEHIYHSCNGGLWGELIWNRSFEQNELGHWTIEDDRIAQQGMGTNVRLTFGDAAWQDYEYSLEARKTGGQEGFLVLFRVKNDKEFYWCNLGGWGNQRHGLERGLATADRWGPVGPQPAGRIASDKWYTIRVRCEGPHIQVWLDDDRVIDYTDDRRAHLSGSVGIGTWATQAVFRNLKVKALDGSVLYEGLPPNLARQNVARFWRPYGSAEVYVDRAGPLNSEVCQKVVTDSNGGGLEQEGFCVRAGQVYEGSVWVKGSATQGLVVRLLGDDGESVAETIEAPSPQWGRRTFALSPTWSCDRASLRIGAKGKADVRIDQVSMMPKPWDDQGGFRPDLIQAVEGLRPPVIRWPGGCFASSYQWKQGIGPQHKRLPHPREIWDDLDVYSYGTDEFIEMCRRVGAEPLIVVNIGSEAWNSDAGTHDYTQDILDWIEYCNGPADSEWGRVRAANGHPEPYHVTYWEIDNETWHLPADRYAEQVRRIAPLMRKADPSIKLAACGSGGMSRNGRNGMPYNRTVIERCADLLDYISIHHYESPNRFARGPSAYEAFFREIGELIEKSSNPKLKIYVSEWNAQSTDWRTGLYCGGLLNAFERCGDILEMGGPALFLRHVSATAWDNAFINFDPCNWFPAPNYVVMKLWRDHYAPERVALSGDTGPLNVVATRRPDGAVIVKAVNPSGEQVRVELSLPVVVSAAVARVVAPGSLQARNSLTQPDRVRVEDHAVQTDGRTVLVEMPALSAAVVVAQTDVSADGQAKIGAASAVAPKARAFRLQDVRLLAGPFREAMERDRQYLLSLEPDRLLHMFRVTAGRSAPGEAYGGWERMELRGHTIGHYLSACALMYAGTGDERLKARADAIVAELALCQKALGESGYLSAYPESFIDRVETLQPVWAPYYTLHKIMAGLLDMYVHAGNHQALEVVEGMARWCASRCDRLSDEQMQEMLNHTEQGGMNAVLANLYAVTNEPEYLALSRRFVQRTYNDPLAAGRDQLKGQHVNSFIPNMIGTARQYELTGNREDFRVAHFFWHQVTGQRCYCTGGTSNHEHWRTEPGQLAGELGDHTQETCCTYNMLKLTRHLFSWEPQAEYMDYYERALFNSILSTQDPKTGMMMYFVSLAPGRWKYYNVPTDAFWCCTGTGMENHAKYGDTIYFHDEDGVFVNLFIGSELNWRAKGVRIRQETRFPEQFATSLSILTEQPKPFALRVRVPGWTTPGVAVRLNGKPLSVKAAPSSYLEIRRTWADGDRIDVTLPARLHAAPMPDDATVVAFMYGPLVLAGKLGGESLTDDLVYTNENWYRFPRDQVAEAPVLLAESDDVTQCIEKVQGEPLTFRTVALAQNLTLVPYHRLFGERYVVYWRVFRAGSDEHLRFLAQEEARRKLRARTLDEVEIGDRRSESAHGMKGERTASGTHEGRSWRHATDGGWFSYDLRVQPGRPLELCVTYWGSDIGGREFDVLVDGEKLATQKLDNNRPGMFYDEIYPLRLRRKETVTVKFQAHPGKTAGGVFGCAIRRPAKGPAH